MRQLDLFLGVMDANGALIEFLHMTADADGYVVNSDDNFGNDGWWMTWQTPVVTTCANEVVQRLQAVPTWKDDPFRFVDMHLRITLTNTETCRFKLLYAKDVDYAGCNMNEGENTFYFNFSMMELIGGSSIPGDTRELSPYFAVDFNDPKDSEVGLCVMMSENDWNNSLTRYVGN